TGSAGLSTTTGGLQSQNAYTGASGTTGGVATGGSAAIATTSVAASGSAGRATQTGASVGSVVGAAGVTQRVDALGRPLEGDRSKCAPGGLLQYGTVRA